MNLRGLSNLCSGKHPAQRSQVRENPGTGRAIPGTTESIQPRSVGRGWRNPQPDNGGVE